jgi:hypothetical protein
MMIELERKHLQNVSDMRGKLSLDCLFTRAVLQGFYTMV